MLTRSVDIFAGVLGKVAATAGAERRRCGVFGCWEQHVALIGAATTDSSECSRCMEQGAQR
jgi:hypothetical protein